MYNWETFQTAYRAATPEQREVVDSEAIPNTVNAVSISKQLDDSHFSKLVKLYALFALGAKDEQAIIGEMRQLGVPEAQVVFAAIKAGVSNQQGGTQAGGESPVPTAPPTPNPIPKAPSINPDPIPQAPAPKANPIPQAPEPNPIPQPPTPKANPIPKAPPTLAQTQANEVPTYSSTQAAILKEGRSEKPTGAPRWDSDHS